MLRGACFTDQFEGATLPQAERFEFDRRMCAWSCDSYPKENLEAAPADARSRHR